MKKISFVFAIVTLCASLCACAGKGEFSLAENTAYTEENAPCTYEELIACENVIVDESLLLINQTHKIKDGDTFDITEYKDSGVLMNSCIHSAYAELSSDVKEKFSEKLYVMSAYRTKEEQLQAIAEEGEKAAGVDESEHRAGLALDVYVKYYAGAAFLQTDTGKYVNSECYKYGFIIRYPKYGEKITGIGYEPWHIRYVGHPHAEIIMTNKITLEEYIESLELGKLYTYGDHIITKQDPEDMTLPQSFESAVVSPDNAGNIIVTMVMASPG